MTDAIRVAFEAASDNWSADRVVVDPELNARFLTACRLAGLTQSDAELNWALLNLRKAGQLGSAVRRKSTRVTRVAQFRFAVEIAARHLEQKHQTTLDRILCDPATAREFDEIARELGPGRSSFEYRWLALRLRKSRRLRPEGSLRLVPPTAVQLGAVDNLDTENIPRQPGLYVFYSSAETLYVGESSNLRTRVATHLDHSDNKNLARWFWSHGFGDVRLELFALPASLGAAGRRALERQLIESRRPRFNIQH